MATRDLRQVQKYAILAFERLRVRDQLELLNGASIDNLESIARMFALEGDLEDALYAEVARQRLRVVRELTKMVDSNAKESVIQRHVYDHLWLLEASWTKQDQLTARVEERVSTEFANVSLTKAEKESRFDVRYRRAGGIHVIVELKRPSVKRSVHQLLQQVKKYKTALTKCLKEVEGIERPNIQCMCLVGEANQDEEDERVLIASNAKVLAYDYVIAEAEKRLSEFVEADKKYGRVQKIIGLLDEASESTPSDH